MENASDSFYDRFYETPVPKGVKAKYIENEIEDYLLVTCKGRLYQVLDELFLHEKEDGIEVICDTSWGEHEDWSGRYLVYDDEDDLIHEADSIAEVYSFLKEGAKTS